MRIKSQLIQYLIREAEPRLPNPAEYGEDEIFIPISLTKDDWQKFNLNELEGEMQLPYYNVLFRKQYYEGEVDWKFVEVD